MNLLRQITHNQSPVIRGFGLGIEGEFTTVPARQLGTTLFSHFISFQCSEYFLLNLFYSTIQ